GCPRRWGGRQPPPREWPARGRPPLSPPQAGVRRPQTSDCGLLPCPKGRAVWVEPDHAFHSSSPLRLQVLAALRACLPPPKRVMTEVFTRARLGLRPSTVPRNRYREAVPSSRFGGERHSLGSLCPGGC